MMMMWERLSLCLLPLLVVLPVVEVVSLSLASLESLRGATSHTNSNSHKQQRAIERSLEIAKAQGYDTLFGTDAICWFTQQQERQRLVPCPVGNALVGEAPTLSDDDHVLRTGVAYNYTATVELNLTSLGFDVSSSWTSETIVDVEVSFVACGVGLLGGMCSPQVVDDYNAAKRIQESQQSMSIPHSVEQQLIQSPWVERQLNMSNDTAGASIHQFQETIPFRVEVPGDYVVIAMVRIKQEQDQQGRVLEMANHAMTEETKVLLRFQEPVQIQGVTPEIRIGSYVTIAIGASVLLWLLFQSIRYRHSQVLQVSQGRFLSVFLLAGVVATTASFLLDPKQDAYCQWGAPLVLCSLQLFYAITLGRVWRIHAIVSPAVMKLTHHTTTNTNTTDQRRRTTSTSDTMMETLLFRPIQKLTSYVVTWENQSRPTSLRKSISELQLVLVVTLFTVPQVLLQLLGATLQPRQITLALHNDNDNDDTARQYCRSSTAVGGSFFFYGCLVFVGLMISLLLMARYTRRLPSLFNESRVIFDSVLSSLTLLAVGAGFLLIGSTGTGSHNNDPSLEYLVCVMVILCATLQASLRLMLPKLKMAWRGETIVVSELASSSELAELLNVSTVLLSR
ncbi:expressed unknown protein [Seminavis robusta]|uniref:G-protein coupled receptors family 3 profile domain-containing protein n=1 Tax=Seminavis robusta TaxID=568900 RepID=A0A9N8EYS0_9STRA|nr:expressed unknown protein [Seminavis robusta]|eukprot:Sro2930_g340460.1 n/a (621) ;mRNA; f:6064-8450